MDPWVIPLFWLIIAVVFIIIEASTFNLFTVWFALAAFVTMFVSIVTDLIFVQVMVFFLVSILSIYTIRNYAVKKFKATTIKTNVNSIIGKKVKVTRQIEPFKFGEVKVDGNYWTAKTLDDQIIKEDSIVEVVEVSGVKLIVRKFD
jgi:membrane protein implicated in regulation of membrane protease activity